jgi:hypothetical protein
MEESLTPDGLAQFWGAVEWPPSFFSRLVLVFVVPGGLCYAELPRDRQP